MPRLIVIPTQFEIDPFLAGCTELGLDTKEDQIGRLPATNLPELDSTVVVGGFGKTQFAVHTQHLIDARSDWSAVICAGAAGALVNELEVGDVVVSTETVEHDVRRSSGKPHPRFPGSNDLLGELRAIDIAKLGFGVHFAVVASGDEDVNHPIRRSEIQTLTGGMAVAWEGAGGARASQFSGLPFVELRGITDQADHTFSADILQNLPRSMRNIASLVAAWCKPNAD